MIHSIVRTGEGELLRELSLDQLTAALRDPASLLWVSLENPDEQEVHSVLADLFHFHPLAIEDCLSRGYQAPKIDEFEDNLFIIVHALTPNGKLHELETDELNCFLGKNYLVTSYLEPSMPAIDAIWKRLLRDSRLLERGVDFLCHAIFDRLVDDFMPLLDTMDEEIEQLEDAVLAKPETPTLERILLLKHDILALRRIVAPQREVMNWLSHDTLPQIAPQNRIYFRDIYDHLVRIHDLSESVRDVVTGTLDIYLSATSNRLNEVMKALTIVSTVFLPLTFVAGVYGMNFEFMPEIRWLYGYPMAWGIFILIVLGMLWFFRRRRWI